MMRKVLLGCVMASSLALTACGDKKEEMMLEDRTMISTTDPLEAQDMGVDGQGYDANNADGLFRSESRRSGS